MTERNQHFALPSLIGWAIVPAGLLAVFATYWDEAWHTDVGRDSAWAAPHVLLYGSVGIVGLGVAVWGVRVLAATRSLKATLADPPLLAAGLGGVGALVAAPIDAAWHEAYGRDAVLWSPPHILVVFASTGLVLGALAGMSEKARALRVVTGVLLLANAVAVVFEYEADVPQFTEILYLPVLLAVGLPAAWLIRRAVPVQAPVVAASVGYAVVRLAIAAALAALGRSTPDWPIAVLGLAAYDLPLRRTASRVLAAAAAVSALAWLASAASLASPPASDVAVAAAPIIALAVIAGLASRSPRVVATVVLALAIVNPLSAERAEAHDPGQGRPVSAVKLTATTDGAGSVRLVVRAHEHCGALAPGDMVARRAGMTLRAPLRRVESCSYQGTMKLPTRDGRWFVYAEFTHDGAPVEAWLPLETGTAGEVSDTRTLYRPAGANQGVSPTQFVTGGLIYLIGLCLLALGIRAIRRRPH